MDRDEIYKEPQYGFEDQILDQLFDGGYDHQRADKGSRIVNYIVDNMAMGFIMLLFFIAMGGMISYFEGINDSTMLTTSQDLTIFVIFITGLFNYLYYYIICEYVFDGKTIGKLLTGTKVIKEDGRKLTFGNVLVRTIVRYIPFEIFSFFGSNQDGWHDKFSGTIVVKDKPKNNDGFV